MIKRRRARLALRRIFIDDIGDVHRPPEASLADMRRARDAMPHPPIMHREIARLRLDRDLVFIRTMIEEVDLSREHLDEVLTVAPRKHTETAILFADPIKMEPNVQHRPRHPPVKNRA